MTSSPNDIHQAQHDPIESLEKLSEFLERVKKPPRVEECGLLTDEEGRNQVVLIFSKELRMSLRLNLVLDDLHTAFEKLGIENVIQVRHMQGQNIDREDLRSLDAVLSIWNMYQSQSVEMAISGLPEFLRALWSNRKLRGRGKAFSKRTLEQLARDSHGYCMFEGCGENLTIDELTRYKGNFGYNAHNIASSEAGPRGVPYLSEYLSDDPQNVLVLCDKHHRLIDKVAAVDFDAGRLSRMRSDFSLTVNSLLEGLSFKPIPVFSILWPVGGHVASEPDERDIANSLSRIKSRSSGRLNRLSNNDRQYRKQPNFFVQNMARVVQTEASEIIQQTQPESHKAALFAFGPMPALVGLGACLGNKCEITPMLRFRDGGCWVWPNDSAVEKPYAVNFDEDEVVKASEVTICIGMTQYPDVMKQTAYKIGFPIIDINANQFGNAAIPHPDNGEELRADLHALLLRLKDEFSINSVHLLICASNAVSVFVGQAFDLYQPSLLVYDFGSELMEPRLKIEYTESGIGLSPPI